MAGVPRRSYPATLVFVAVVMVAMSHVSAQSAPSSTPSATVCSFVAMNGTTISPHAYWGTFEVGSAEECQDRCCTDPRCRSADFSAANGTCQLSNVSRCDMSGMQSRPGVVLFVLNTTAPCRAPPPAPSSPTASVPPQPSPTPRACWFTTTHGRMITGDAATVWLPDATACQSRCCSDPRCRSADYSSTRNVCRLSNQTQCEAMLSPSADFAHYERNNTACTTPPAPGTLPPNGTECAFLTINGRRLFPGYTFDTLWRVPSPADCQRLCCEHARCRSAEYVMAQGICYLSDKTQCDISLLANAEFMYLERNNVGCTAPPWLGTSPQPSYSSPTLVPTPPPPPPPSCTFVAVQGMLIVGDHIARYNEISVETCRALCCANSTCRSVDYVSIVGGCYLSAHTQCDSELYPLSSAVHLEKGPTTCTPKGSQPSPAPPSSHTPPTPEPSTGFTQAAAIHFCEVERNWISYASRGEEAIVCTKPGTDWSEDCNECDTWMLVVYRDGGRDLGHNGAVYPTVAGHYYGGHSPCRTGWNLAHCGRWMAAAAPVPPTTIPVGIDAGIDHAKQYCEQRLGWNASLAVPSQGGAIVCTKPGTNTYRDCNTCDSWRLVVWENGGQQSDSKYFDSRSGDDGASLVPYATLAGHSYGGHTPCQPGWNLRYCGRWLAHSELDVEGPSPSQSPPSEDAGFFTTRNTIIVVAVGCTAVLATIVVVVVGAALVTRKRLGTHNVSASVPVTGNATDMPYAATSSSLPEEAVPSPGTERHHSIDVGVAYCQELHPTNVREHSADTGVLDVDIPDAMLATDSETDQTATRSESVSPASQTDSHVTSDPDEPPQQSTSDAVPSAPPMTVDTGAAEPYAPEESDRVSVSGSDCSRVA